MHLQPYYKRNMLLKAELHIIWQHFTQTVAYETLRLTWEMEIQFFFMVTTEKSDKKIFLEYITEYWHVIQKYLIHWNLNQF